MFWILIALACFGFYMALRSLHIQQGRILARRERPAAQRSNDERSGAAFSLVNVGPGGALNSPYMADNHVGPLYEANARHENKMARLEERLVARDAELTRVNAIVAQLVGSGARRLHDYQKAAIKNALAPLNQEWIAAGHEGIQFSVFWTGAGDCAEYAKQFEDLLTDIGFRKHIFGMPMQYEHDYFYGITVLWDSAYEKERGLPPVGETLMSALAFCEIDARGIDEGGGATRVLQIVVGARRY